MLLNKPLMLAGTSDAEVRARAGASQVAAARVMPALMEG